MKQNRIACYCHILFIFTSMWPVTDVHLLKNERRISCLGKNEHLYAKYQCLKRIISILFVSITLFQGEYATLKNVSLGALYSKREADDKWLGQPNGESVSRRFDCHIPEGLALQNANCFSMHCQKSE